MACPYRLERFGETYILVVDVANDKPLGWFASPRPGDRIGTKAWHPSSQLQNLADFPEYAGIQAFAIFGFGIDEQAWAQLGLGCGVSDALVWIKKNFGKTEKVRGWIEAGFEHVRRQTLTQ